MSSTKNAIDTKKIRHLLIEKDLEQKEVARRVGVSSRMISHVINGTRVCWPIRKKLAAVLGVALEEISQRRNSMPHKKDHATKGRS